MRRAAIAALMLIAVCSGAVWWLASEPEQSEEPRVHVSASSEPTGKKPADSNSPSDLEPAEARPSSTPDSPAPTSLDLVPPAEVMPSPFEGHDSAELQYAEAMLYAPDAGAPAFLAAGEVYERCLRSNPANQWCALGLVTAQRALETGAPGPNPFDHGEPQLRMPRVKGVIDNLGAEPRQKPAHMR